MLQLVLVMQQRCTAGTCLRLFGQVTRSEFFSEMHGKDRVELYSDINLQKWMILGNINTLYEDVPAIFSSCQVRVVD